MIDKLEYLIALAREKHFGRAADVCGVTQPTLSAGLKQLEAQLGAPLVDRGSRFVGLTAEGERALVWARRIVGDARGLAADVAALKTGLGGHLRLAVVPTALPMVARLTIAFAERHPNVRLTITSRTSAEILALLDDLEIDAGLTYIDNEPLGRITAAALYRERPHLVTARGGATAARASVTWAEVGMLPLCLLTPDMQNRRIIDRILAEIGVEARPTLESNSLMVLAAHVRSGRWATVMPRIMVEAMGLADTAAAIPIVGPEVAHTIGLVTRPRDPMPPLVAALTATVKRLAPSFEASA